MDHWWPTSDRTRAVRDSRDGSSFEIRAEPHFALNIYFHPFAYRSFGTVADDSRRTEVVR